MSGGGGGSKKDKTSNVNMPMDTVQPAMPGQLDALSQQLSMGYGQTPADILAQLNQYYAPMQLPDYGPQPAPAPAPKPTPSPTSPRRPLPSRGIIGGANYSGHGGPGR